jgi:thiol:disulfide interchange protein DsbD
VKFIACSSISALSKPSFKACGKEVSFPAFSKRATIIKKFSVFLALIFIGAIFCTGQNQDEIVSIKISSTQPELERGKQNKISLQIKIKPPYHINANQPTEEYLIPTKIDFQAEKGLLYSDVAFPRPESKKFSFSSSPLLVFEGIITVTASVTIPASSKEKEVAVSGTLSYQACDDQSCLPPEDLDFTKKFPLSGKSEAVALSESQESSQKQNENIASVQALNESDIAQMVGEKGLALSFLLIFIAGLALDLTPCVYPMIPITIGYFVNQEQGRKRGVVINAALYVLGMCITYSTLGVAASLTGNLFGAALQNPVVIIFIALVLIILSLSMFDLFEFRVPGFLANLAGRSKKGYFGSLFIGLMVGILAAPCIGPFVLGLLIYIGEKGSVIMGFLMFFVLALGLGMPFLFLAIFSGNISKLPKSSAWMVWVRTIFGFILIAMATYFLGPLFPNVLIYNLAMALIFLLGGIYMAWIEPTKLQGKTFPVIRNIVGIIFFALALFLAWRGIQSYTEEKVKSAILEATSSVQADTIRWLPYSENRLKQAADQSKSIFLDFMADWCIPCREMDLKTFADSEIIAVSQNFLMLKIDMTSSSNPQIKRLQKKFNIKGVPTYIFLKPDGAEIQELRTVGYLDAGKLKAKMERAIKLTNN